MGDNNSDELFMVMNLDLNEEPPDTPIGSVSGLGSLLNELETAHGRIEERIRQLEAVTARARERQRWREVRNNPEISNVSVEHMVDVGLEGGMRNDDANLGALEMTAESDRSCKSDSTNLVAKALGMDSDSKKVVGGGGSFFDCNICLKIAKEPILTCCGHLFCWTCFYQLSYVDSTAKECTVCGGEVTDTNITPIYINGNSSHVPELRSGMNIPPRPQAHRVESVRQQRVTRGLSHVPVAEALRRIRTGIGAMREHSRQQDIGSLNISSSRISQVFPNAEAGVSGSFHSRPFSRVLSESAASLSSISSALNNTERLVEDLETYIQERLIRGRHGQHHSVYGGDPHTGDVAVMHLERQATDSTAEINFAESIALPTEMINASASLVHLDLENLATDAITEPLPSSRRRSSRILNAENQARRELRRRRFR